MGKETTTYVVCNMDYVKHLHDNGTFAHNYANTKFICLRMEVGQSFA
jgi:hypothetical protein